MSVGYVLPSLPHTEEEAETQESYRTALLEPQDRPEPGPRCRVKRCEAEPRVQTTTRAQTIPKGRDST